MAESLLVKRLRDATFPKNIENSQELRNVLNEAADYVEDVDHKNIELKRMTDRVVELETVMWEIASEECTCCGATDKARHAVGWKHL